MLSRIAFINAVVFTSASALSLPVSPSGPLVARAFSPLPDDPSMTPVNVKDLAASATMTCGSTTFNYDDIYAAVQWATIVEKENLGRGKKSKDYPKGRFPHSYTAEDFTFNGDCPADTNREEYPLIVDGPYNGGTSNNVQWGDHRVIYYDKGEEAADANPVVYFCGGITHEGAATTADFVQCTVN